MKVAIEARALSAKGGGVRMYVQELLRHLDPYPDEFHVLATEKIPEASHITQHTVPLASPLFLPWWLNRVVPRRLKSIQPNVVHFTKADVPKRKQFPTVVTIYDVIPLLFPESQSFTRRLYWPQALKRAAHISDHIITISEASKKGISELFDIPLNSITVTPLAADLTHFRPTPHQGVLKKFQVTKPYILFVGTRDRRKNIQTLLRSFKEIADSIPHDVVLIGKPAFREDDTLSLIQELNLQERVHVLENVPYEQLPVFYTHADLFVWPSIYEGYGLPPLEALACGTPVITSDGGSLPEVVGDAGTVIPFTVEKIQDRIHDEVFGQQLSQVMGDMLHDESLRTRNKEKGIERAHQFSWDRVAEQTLEVYKKFA